MKQAVSVVLLPEESIAKLGIFLSEELHQADPRKRIILGETDFLPHITLTMGYMDPNDLKDIETILERISQETNPLELTIDNIYTIKKSLFTGLGVSNTGQLRSLHDTVSSALRNKLTHLVEESEWVTPPEVNEMVPSWVTNYPIGKSFNNYDPHITLGKGTTSAQIKHSIPFTAPYLVLARMGNFCTVRKPLATFDLQSSL